MVEKSKRKAVGDCLAASGFVEFADGGPQEYLDETPPAVGGYPEYMRRRIEMESADGIEVMANPSLHLEHAWSACKIEADREIPDPVAVYSGWLDAISSDLGSRVESDERYQDAVQERRACFAEAGYVEGSTDPLVARSTEIYLEFRKGSIDEATALEQLDELADLEDPAVQLASQCQKAFTDRRDLVADEYQQALLEQNGSLVTELEEEMQVAFAELQEGH